MYSGVVFTAILHNLLNESPEPRDINDSSGSGEKGDKPNNRGNHPNPENTLQNAPVIDLISAKGAHVPYQTCTVKKGRWEEAPIPHEAIPQNDAPHAVNLRRPPSPTDTKKHPKTEKNPG
jgi:hypothetical protein